MAQQLQEAYANVLEFDALGDGSGDQTANIQSAIDSGRHVLFPAGTYAISGCLTFPHDDQRCRFLAGAILQPQTKSAYVLITGDRQVIEGLRVEPKSGVAAHSPLVEIYAANELVLEDLRVSIPTWPTATNPILRSAVRVQGTDTCTFIGGRISGSSESTTVGLWLTDYPPPSSLPTPGALARISATGFEIREFGWALRIDCDVDGVTLIGCALLNNVDGSVNVRSYGSGDQNPEVASLCLVDCRMAGSDPDQYLRVAEGCSWTGGVVAGCIFDELTAEGSRSPQRRGSRPWATGEPRTGSL